MNKNRSLLLLVTLLASCLLLFSPKAATQNDNRIRPTGAIFDPCALPNSPSNCIPTPTPTPTPMPIQRDERKGVVLGPASVLRQDEDMGDQDLRGPAGGKTNIEILNESRTGYVRFWIDWPALQPDAGVTFDDIKANPLTATLNEQIKLARDSGLKVILTVHHRYPLWATGTPASTCACAEGDAQCHNRCAEALQKVPSRLDAGSPWAQFINFLVSEYGRTTERTNRNHPEYNRYVDFLEIVNEPNLTHRTPRKRTNGGRLVIAMKVADMFGTAQRILLARPDVTLKLAGPATSDTLKNNNKVTSYRAFTLALLAELARDGFRADENWAWSHHNYLDLEEQRNCPPGDEDCAPAKIRVNGQTETAKPCNPYRDARGRQKLLSRVNSAAWVEEKLEDGVDGYKWGGMRYRAAGGSSHPAVLLTEGGVRLDKVFEIYWCRIDGLARPVREPYLCRCPSNFGAPVPCFNAPADSPGGACTVEVNPEYVAFRQSVLANMETIKRWQAELVRESFNLMTRGASSKGIALFTNYLAYTDPKYDTGMFDYLGSCDQYSARADRTFGDICTGQAGGHRPLFDVWKSLTTP